MTKEEGNDTRLILIWISLHCLVLLCVLDRCYALLSDILEALRG